MIRERAPVVAGDMPFPPPALRRRRAQPSHAVLVIPRSPRGFEPPCVVHAARCAGALRARIARGAPQVSDLAGAMRMEDSGPGALAAYDPRRLVFLTVNTPHDCQEALESSAELKAETPTDRITD